MAHTAARNKTAAFAAIEPAESTGAERRDWLRLIRSENVGPITFGQLIGRFGTASKAIAALPDLARRGGKSGKLKICTIDQADAEIEMHQKSGCKLILACDAEYPDLLRQVEDAPPVISIRGHAHLLQKPCVGIVGTRNASAAGRKFTEILASNLGGAGYVISSGLARGIDSAAHTASLGTGTIAVMAGGIDQVYPPDNQKLYDQIADQGVLISEIEFGINPQARHFPRRNRIVSGLSLGIVVIEAALQSGSLITARCALDQNREVFAVPGSPLDPRCNGTNSLIKQGATLVESADDIIDVLRRISPPSAHAKSDLFYRALAFAEQQTEDLIAKSTPVILELLGATPTPLDDVIRLSELPPAIVMSVVMELELAGRLQRFPGNKVALFYH